MPPLLNADIAQDIDLFNCEDFAEHGANARTLLFGDVSQNIWGDCNDANAVTQGDGIAETIRDFIGHGRHQPGCIPRSSISSVSQSRRRGGPAPERR